ncbi:SNARE-binding exocyst subunit S6 [Coniosporium apollinis]|uniref:SNARE-binding exocyst subunit S6 n=1 Tax=Coniosporium apollinis TaxID=61459 RepID=A0ABQ9NTV2_9PEZI|nr:SNARE-binding exocyst subunit S6 [Coniosporium apollinis]
MNHETPTRLNLTELLRHPEDLDKLQALKAEFTRRKAAVDAQLRHGLQSQLAITSAGMTSLSDGQRTVNQIKDEMMKIDKLCAEAQNMIRDFPNINRVSQIHRNFEAVLRMKGDIEGFEERLGELEGLLRLDDEEMGEDRMGDQPNLLAVHYGLTQLRDVRDAAMGQVKSAGGRDGEEALELINNLRLETGRTLQDYFGKLDEVIEWFDEHVGEACTRLIDHVVKGNHGLVVRLALVIEEEEKSDKKVQALQDAQKEFKDLASRFKSIAAGPKERRGYKEKFLKAIEASAAVQIELSNERFLDDPEKLEKSVRWYFNDLNTVKVGMVSLMPRKWKIFKTYVGIYHRLMHDWLISRIDDKDLTPIHTLAIIHWEEKYYTKMQKLEVPLDWLQPHLIDDRGPELVREYRQLIVRAVEEWMERMDSADRQSFLTRPEGALDTDGSGHFRTKTMADMWIMLREQLAVASNSQRTDVAEGVVDAMFRSLDSRQRMWESLIDGELARFSAPNSDTEGLQPLQDWLVAIANDQIACIDDGDESAAADPSAPQTLSYLTKFSRDIVPLVSAQYVPTATQQTDALRDGYVDLGTHSISVFAALVFACDFRSILPEFFTPAWYAANRMGQICSTFRDYLDDYAAVLHPSLHSVLVEEFSDALLVAYLSAVRNKGAKFRRQDPFTEKIREDVVAVFGFFERFEAFGEIKRKWRAVDGLVKLLEADKGEVANVFERVSEEWWDVGLGWVEAVLRARDDFERGMLRAVKERAAAMEVQRGPETIMGKVRV